MRREFATHLTFLIVANALVKPVYLLGIELGVQNAVGTEEYGRYSAWFSFAFLFGVVQDLGLQSYNGVTMARDPRALAERLPLLLTLKLLLSSAFAVVVLSAALAVGADARGLGLAGLAVLYHVSMSALQLLRTNLGAQERYRFNSAISVTDKLLLIVGLGAVLLVGTWRAALTVEAFFAAQICATVATCALALYGTRRPARQRWFSWDRREVLRLLTRALPYGLTLLLTTAFTRIDIIMVAGMRGDYAAGVYAAAYRLLDGASMVGYMFATLLVPIFSKLIAANAPQLPLLRQAGGYIAVFGLTAATFTTFNAEAVVELLYREATAEWGAVLGWLMWAALGIGIAYVHGSYLLARQRMRTLNLLFAAALLANVALNLALIPHYGARGAAIATALTQCGVGAVELYLVRRGGGAGVEGPADRLLPWRGAVLFLAGSLAAGFGVSEWGLDVAVAACAHVAVCGGLGLATGLLDDPRRLRAV